MIHACNAIDGTAAKVYPNLANNNAPRFKKLLRENCLSIIEPMANQSPPPQFPLW